MMRDLIRPGIIAGVLGAVAIDLYLIITQSLRRFGVWRVRPILTGIVFGTIAMLVMRYAVVPLGHAHQPNIDALRLTNLWVAHTLGFGIPVAIVFKKLSSPA